jgi:hypothetical protein
MLSRPVTEIALLLLSWVRHRPPVLIVSWWGSLQWVNPLQPSIRSAGQSFFSLLLCWCISSCCNMGLLWFPSLSWWFVLFSWMTSSMNGTFRSSCRVWSVTYQGAFVIISSILNWLRVQKVYGDGHWDVKGLGAKESPVSEDRSRSTRKLNCNQETASEDEPRRPGVWYSKLQSA